MTGHRFSATHVALSFAISQLAYRMKVVARRAGPSLCGRPRFIKGEEMLGALRRSRRTPTIGVSGLVDIEFWFTQTTCGHRATGVGYLLDELLGFEKLVDIPAQGNICAAGDLLSDHLEGERSIADPSVEIIRIDSVRAGNDDPSLEVKILGSTK
jgi:hypothetical protein